MVRPCLLYTSRYRGVDELLGSRLHARQGLCRIRAEPDGVEGGVDQVGVLLPRGCARQDLHLRALGDSVERADAAVGVILHEAGRDFAEGRGFAVRGGEFLLYIGCLLYTSRCV